MAIAGNRSPSPNTNSRPNSNKRNSEENSSMGRSFGGNPFQRPSIHTNTFRGSVPATPANSPADFASRSYLTKEEKENDHDHYQTLKPVKARSPSVPKGTNHFMMPTISAVSKINPSPRKKVLSDRNELLRTSISFSAGKSSFVSVNFSDCTENYDKKPDKETPNPNPSPKVASIAPLDADPPPYDSKTNYLSPRPQFLHYKPNPRLELYFQEQGSETKNLEDSFLNESFSSDTEVSEGFEPESSQNESEDGSSVEAVSENSQKESEDAFSAEVVSKAEPQISETEPITIPVSIIKDNEENCQKGLEDASPVKVVMDQSQKESKDASSVEVVCEEAESKVSQPELITNTEVSKRSEHENFQEESKNTSLIEVLADNSQKESVDDSPFEVVSKEAETEVSEPEPTTNPTSSHVPEETSEEKREVKSCFFSRAKFMSLLLFLLFACTSVSFIDSPISYAPVYKNLTSSEFYEERFESVARSLKLWSVHSTSYVNELISSLSGADKYGPVQFINLTYKQEDPFIYTKRSEEIYEQDEVENLYEDEDEFERLLDENLENGDHNKENELDFDSELVRSIASYSSNGIDLEEKSCLEALEFSLIEAETEGTEGDDQIVSDSQIESIITVPSFRNTFDLSSGEVAAFKEVKGDIAYNSEIAETVGIEGDGHLVSDSEIESTITEVPSLGNTFEIGISQVDPESDFKKPENLEIKDDDGPLVSDSETDPIKVESDSENTLEMDDSTLDLKPDYKSSEQYKALAISLLALVLIAAPVVIYLKNKTASAHNSTVLMDPILTNKTTKSNTDPQSYSPEAESEMSSFDGNYSYSKGYTWGITNEAQSRERKQKRVLKRESLASSSGFSVSDSPSYGSFTTYERLLSKHGYDDDEVVTPVRRSSRIKKIQVTSP